MIATGIYPPHVGGPAEYAKNLSDEYRRRGNDVVILTYERAERLLPPGLRHLWFFVRVLRHMWGVDAVIALDTLSVGFPAVIAAMFFGKYCVVRTGGDFLYEAYLNRTGSNAVLSEFYSPRYRLNFKERLIFTATTITLRSATAIAFSTQYQKNIFERAYGLDKRNTYIVENYFGEKLENFLPTKKVFLTAARPIVMKNIECLRVAFAVAQKNNPEISLEIVHDISYAEVCNKLAHCYAALLPSLTDISPNFILDAVRRNKPFILTRETGFVDVFGECGIFVDPTNIEQIAGAITWLSNDENWAAQSLKISEFSHTHSWSEIADELLGGPQKI